MKILLATAAHRQTKLPEQAPFVPIEVGAALREQHLTDGAGRPILRDDAGENISAHNAEYCELTALYRLWKNPGDADALGLCHYRRLFGQRRFGPKEKRLLTQERAEKLLQRYDCILPAKRHYFIQSGYDQYAHAHHERDLTVTRGVLEAMEDKRYAAAFDRTMRRTSGHRFNMLLMRRSLFDAYCEWLFGVLFQVEQRLDIQDYSPKDRRVFGYLGERLLDVWLEVRKPSVKELPVVYTESQHWPRKILSFIKRLLSPARA